MKFLKNNWQILTIIFIASLTRLILLGSIPVGINDDEAAFGYNAYSIIQTGRDEWGRLLPFPIFESFGDWKLAGYFYFTAISVWILGLTEFATRLPSAIFGIFSVYATYLLTKELFNKKTGYIAAFLLAISPWHIVASRNAFESDVLIFFTTLGTYFFLVSRRNKKFLTLSLLSFLICFYIYRSSWIFVPLFSLSLLYFFRNDFKKTQLFIKKYAALVILLLLPLLPVVLTFQGQSRFIQESFLSGISRSGIINEVNEKQALCQKISPRIICRIAHNKYSTFLGTYTNNYVGNLSYSSYFEKSIPTGFQSFATRSTFYLFEFPLLILGLFFLFRQRNPALKILIPWILIVPIGASFAGTANFGRINIIMPAPQIIGAFGFVSLIAAMKGKTKILTFIISAGIIIVSFLSFLSELFLVEPAVTGRYQRYGYKNLFNYLSTQEKNYDNIYVSKKIDNSHQYIQYTFSQKINPQYFIENSKRTKGKDGWTEFEGIGKYKFVPSMPEVQLLPTKTLIVVGEHEVNFKNPQTTIKDLKGDILFKVFDTDELNESIFKESIDE